jgi:acyl carrier protein
MAWTTDGRLMFLGRDDEQIKLRGYRIEPGEVEASILELPGVEEAAVVARPQGTGATWTSDRGALQLVAVLRTSKAGVPASWRHDLAAKLPNHMIPSRLVEVADLPRLPNGKIDRRRLRTMALDPEVAVEWDGQVPTAREQALISLWEGLLGRSGIGVTDNFFELGGHSLLVVEMAVAIEQDFEVELSAADVFENPTVRELGARIAQRGGPRSTPYDHLFPIQPAGRGAPFVVAVPHFFTHMFAARFRGERPVYGLRGVGLRAEGNLGRWRTMLDLGEDLVAEICRRFPDDRYYIAGYSFGATMAFEAVRLMEERGLHVEGLYLIAPMPFDLFSLGPLRLQIDGLRQPVGELSVREVLDRYLRSNSPLTLQPYRRAWRWLAIEPWRRFLCAIGRLRRLAGLPLTDRISYADVRVDRFRLHANYRPGTLRTPTVIFNAVEPATDAAATWRPFFDGPITVHDIPDPHLGEDSAEAARREILSHLRELGEA